MISTPGQDLPAVVDRHDHADRNAVGRVAERSKLGRRCGGRRVTHFVLPRCNAVQ